MASESVVYVLFPAIAAVLAFLLALLAWERRPAPGATPFVVVLLSVMEWSLAYTAELLATGLGAKVFWAQVSYIGIVVLPVAWLLFALEYSGNAAWSGPRTVALLAVVPVATTALVWTWEAHGLFWRSVDLRYLGTLTVLEYQYGPAFRIHAVYSYALILLGMALLGRVFVRSPIVHRRRLAALLMAVTVPLIGNAVYVLGLSPSGIDTTTLGFAIGGVPLFWAFFRYRFLDLASAARERVFETIDVAVFLLDADHRLVDLNPAAEALAGLSRSEAVGRPFEEVLSPASNPFESATDRIYRDEIHVEVDGR